MSRQSGLKGRIKYWLKRIFLSPITFLVILSSVVAGYVSFGEYLASEALAVNSTATASTNSWVTLTLGQSISLKMDYASMKFDINPTADGVFAHKTVGMTVSTNNETGYVLTMSVRDNDNALNFNGHKINSLTTSKTISSLDTSSFTTNSWGYTLLNNLDQEGVSTEFSPIKTVNEPDTLKRSDDAINEDQTKVTVGVKADTTLEPGTYENELMFSAITNGLPPLPTLPEFYTIATLQDMTTEICNSVATPKVTAQLMDPIGIHFEDSNYVPESLVTDSRDGQKYTIRKLSDGHCWMVRNLNLGSRSKNIVLTPEDSDVAKTVILPKLQVDAGLPWAADWESTPEEIDTQHMFANGDLKYGVLYNWYTATAGSGNSRLTYADAPHSICAKGWRIPTLDNYNEMLATYEVEMDTVESYEKIQKIPLEFAMPGYYSAAMGAPTSEGTEAQYWTSTAGGYGAGSMYVYVGFVFTWDDNDKANGLAVRCVAR